MQKIIKTGLTLLLVLACSTAYSNERIAPELIDRVIDEMSEALVNYYVFPDVGDAIAQDLRGKLESGAYQNIADISEFTGLLTSQMRAVSDDEHLFIFYSDQPVVTAEEMSNPTPEEEAANLAMHRHFNYGVSSVGRLDGNIGYFDFGGFMDAEPSAEAIGMAMNLMQSTAGLIVDLRQNYGGAPETVALLASYFVGPDPVHVDSIYWRKTDTTKEFWTSTELDGPWYGTQRPVYILTSSETFSAAEAFSYAMQAMGRAEIVGETTRGGAHPGGIERVADNFGLWVSSGRAINAVTGSNWEGTGVSPDHPIDADSALLRAHQLILEKTIAQTDDRLARQDMEMHLTRLQQDGHP